MADNVPISAGAGTDIATDQATDNAHVQLFKLAYSADGSRVLVPADADGLTVKALGLISDTVPSLSPDMYGPLSLATDGRLRVVTSNESYNFTAWGDPFAWGDPGLEIESHPITAW